MECAKKQSPTSVPLRILELRVALQDAAGGARPGCGDHLCAGTRLPPARNTPPHRYTVHIVHCTVPLGIPEENVG
jgi:hypothetical protein